MKTKHTEGEWVIEPFQVGVSNGWMNIRLPEYNFATVYSGKYMDALNPNDEIIREVEANSKLIAAAPDLLEMLIKIYQIENHAFSLKGFDVVRLKEEVGAAINKATL